MKCDRTAGKGSLTYELVGQLEELIQWLESIDATWISAKAWVFEAYELRIFNLQASDIHYLEIKEDAPASLKAKAEKFCIQTSYELEQITLKCRGIMTGKLVAKKTGCVDIALARVSAQKVGERIVLVMVAKIVPSNPLESHYEGTEPFTVTVPKDGCLWANVSAAIVHEHKGLVESDEISTMEWDTPLIAE